MAEEQGFWGKVGDVLIGGISKKIDAEIYGVENIGNQAQYDETYTRQHQQAPLPDGQAVPSSNVSVGGVQLNKTSLLIAAAALGVALFLSRG